MSTLTAVIANHLNIIESIIIEVQEWANVLWVKFTSGRPRFVSKKVKPQEEHQAMTTEKIGVTGIELADKIAKEWNSKNGSEWHSQYAGFPKANVWNKKEGEIRIYIGKGYIKLFEKAPGQGTVKFVQLQYNFQDLAVEVVKEISSKYKMMGLQKVEKNKQWHDEDGNVIDPDLNPADAVAFY